MWDLLQELEGTGPGIGLVHLETFGLERPRDHFANIVVILCDENGQTKRSTHPPPRDRSPGKRSHPSERGETMAIADH